MDKHTILMQTSMEYRTKYRQKQKLESNENLSEGEQSLLDELNLYLEEKQEEIEFGE